jgi:serine/threonine protein phosphatase 1
MIFESALKDFFSRAEVRANKSLGLPRPERPVAVIGDVHGCADLLVKLVRKLPQDVDWVFVGDLIDRGESSEVVLRFVYDLCETTDGVYCLMGNHERMLLDFLRRPQKSGSRWMQNGGLQTLASFGINGLSLDPGQVELDRLATTLRETLGKDLIDWMETLPLIWQSGNLAIVHAAADPVLPFDQQSDQTLLWGKSDFLNTPRRDGSWVAHGHTIVDEPVFASSRISIDTGAFHSRRLTAAVIDTDGNVEFITA